MADYINSGIIEILAS